MSLRRPRSTGLTRALRNARTLSRNDWAVFIGALGLLPAVAVGLRLVGLRRLLVMVEILASIRRGRRAGDPLDAERAARLVEAAARCCLPRPTCLAKALVVFALVKRRGLPAEVIIGVTKARGPLEGHAWVRLGRHVVGGPASSGYTALVRIADGRVPGGARAVPGEHPS